MSYQKIYNPLSRPIQPKHNNTYGKIESCKFKDEPVIAVNIPNISKNLNCKNNDETKICGGTTMIITTQKNQEILEWEFKSSKSITANVQDINCAIDIINDTHVVFQVSLPN